MSEFYYLNETLFADFETQLLALTSADLQHFNDTYKNSVTKLTCSEFVALGMPVIKLTVGSGDTGFTIELPGDSYTVDLDPKDTTDNP